MKFLYLALLLFCLLAILPFHCPEDPRGAEPIMRTPGLLGEVQHQIVLQLHDASCGHGFEGHAIELLDHDEEFGHSRSSVRQNTIPAYPSLSLEKPPEMLLQTRYPMRDVADGYPFDFGGTCERLLWMHEALVGEGYPEEQVCESDRVSSPLAQFLSARVSRRTLCASRILRLRDLGLLPHPGGMLEAESERTPNESLKKFCLQRIRVSNPKNLDGASRQLQSFGNGRLRCRDKAMVAIFGLEVLIMVYLEVALDRSTREIVSFRISDSLAASGAKLLLQNVATGDSWKERQLELDRFRLDGMIVPDTV